MPMEVHRKRRRPRGASGRASWASAKDGGFSGAIQQICGLLRGGASRPKNVSNCYHFNSPETQKAPFSQAFFFRLRPPTSTKLLSTSTRFAPTLSRARYARAGATRPGEITGWKPVPLRSVPGREAALGVFVVQALFAVPRFPAQHGSQKRGHAGAIDVKRDRLLNRGVKALARERAPRQFRFVDPLIRRATRHLLPIREKDLSRQRMASAQRDQATRPGEITGWKPVPLRSVPGREAALGVLVPLWLRPFSRSRDSSRIMQARGNGAAIGVKRDDCWTAK
jgi:hypothetical protein